MHPESQPIPSEQRPADGVMGRWGSNASCVAISPNYIITTRHQDGGVGTTVQFNGESFRVAAIMNEPADDGAADLRVCLITRPDGTLANRSDHVELYCDNPVGKSIVVGGFGYIRGAFIDDPDVGLGYQWLSSCTLNWGANTIDGTATKMTNGYTSSTVQFDFGPYDAQGQPYECAVALGDSGGGWFVQDGGEWKLAALSAYVQYSGASFYDLAAYDYGEWHWGIRLQSYLSWIAPLLIEPPCSNASAADITEDCLVGVADLSILGEHWLTTCNETNEFCGGGDVFSDGIINLEDFAVMAGNWLECGYAEPWG